MHVLLFVITLITTTCTGIRLFENFENNRAVRLDDLLISYSAVLDPAQFIRGLPYSLTLLAILFAHEMGHYITCLYYRINASPPCFLPSPLLIGTFGAFIRIRSPIYRKRELFDVGVAGPIAGFVLAVPALAVGLAFSKIIPGIGAQGDVTFSTPLLQRLLEMAVMPGVPTADILLHPVARAAWFGLFATALNLLPIGQLDGGHILYSFVGDWHKPLSRLFAVALLPLAWFTQNYSWVFWAVLLLFIMRHPRIYDETRMDAGRGKLGLLALAMLILCFTAAPIRT